MLCLSDRFFTSQGLDGIASKAIFELAVPFQFLYNNTQADVLTRSGKQSTSILGSVRLLKSTLVMTTQVPFDDAFLEQKMKLIKSCMDWKAISTIEQRWDDSVCQVFVSEFRKDVLELEIVPPETPVFHDSQCTPDYFSDQLLRCTQQWWSFLVNLRTSTVSHFPRNRSDPPSSRFICAERVRLISQTETLNMTQTFNPS